ncbi:COX15/CtaA family protein [Sporolactobacillus inulinus]|uniref:Cytochrome caa3 oxidase controlling protein n=1 Tax=Sporolactobacillus inulinus CASD TaxID=1069536 RepID=A0A0U1QMI0_9BACL|nr:heme A synthase [Sporolactobacillus inulinus]KLI02018.1 cytochrome caa3 oxidase controlling protein [Sporolactobacillus inulinus CASD]GEB77547.1 heme A synthase [Sporolactobacillus inulinus]
MRSKWLKIISVAGTLAVLIVVLMGALVTNTGSEYGCGNNWPLCNGKVIPDAQTHHTWIEYSHRVVSGLASLLVVVQAVWLWIRFKHVWGMRFLACSSVFFIFLQAFLGMAAVVWGQSSVVLALHFGISLLSFASMVLLTCLVFEQVNPNRYQVNLSVRTPMKWNFILLGIYTYILVYSGAFVRHTESSLGCTDFPLCNGHLFPEPWISKAGVQYLHRILALILLVWLVGTLIAAIKRYKRQEQISNLLFVILILVFLQAVAGIFIVTTKMNLLFLLLHAFFVTGYFGILTILILFGCRPEKK